MFWPSLPKCQLSTIWKSSIITIWLKTICLIWQTAATSCFDSFSRLLKILYAQCKWVITSTVFILVWEYDIGFAITFCFVRAQSFSITIYTVNLKLITTILSLLTLALENIGNISWSCTYSLIANCVGVCLGWSSCITGSLTSLRENLLSFLLHLPAKNFIFFTHTITVWEWNSLTMLPWTTSSCCLIKRFSIWWPPNCFPLLLKVIDCCWSHSLCCLLMAEISNFV